MQRTGQGERGAALVTVLLFLVLILILIMSMLTVTGNEVVISGLQRDGVRALDLAQGAVQEAVRRIEEGRPYTQGFTSSLNPQASVAVIRRVVGTNAAFQEIQATASVGRATRRVSLLVLQRMVMFPPNITFANSVEETGSAEITRGDVYTRTFINYKNLPSDPNTLTYAGWWVSKASGSGPSIPPCYTHAACVAAGQSKWYPGLRRTDAEESALGTDIKMQTTKCPAGGGGSLPPDTVSGVLATDLSPGNPPETTVTNFPAYGFDTDDPDGAGPMPPLAVTPQLPCGLPYKIVAETFQDENNNSVTRLFKTVVFEQWFDLYWQFDEGQLTYVKKSTLVDHPPFAAVPPFPEFSSVEGNYDRREVGGGVVNSGDFGCKAPEMVCTPPVSRPIILWLDGGDWTINANVRGHGTIVVDGNLTVNGDLEYWGTIIVNGQLTLGSGNVTVHGGLVARSTLRLAGNITVEGGGTITNVPVGRSVVLGRAWWER